MTVYYLCQVNSNVTLGGVKVLYRQVDVLNEAGISAAIVHGRVGFRCTWFRNSTRVVHPPLQVQPGDLLALPEAFGPRLRSLAPGVPKVVINQNAHYVWHGVTEKEPHPYLDAADLVGVTCISEQNRQLMQHTFPTLDIFRVRYSLDAELYTDIATGARPRRIAYMPRKRVHEANQVLGMLRTRGVLKDWEVVALEGLCEREVVEALNRCALFLSFSEHEGCPLPPVEALASGCFVIGYTGFGAREYFDPRYAVEVQDGDVHGFAVAVERWLTSWGDGAVSVDSAAASAFALRTFSRESERQSVLDFYGGVFQRLAGSRGRSCVLRSGDVLLTGDGPGVTEMYRRMRFASRVVMRGS